MDKLEFIAARHNKLQGNPMTLLPEQLSAAGKSPFEAQFDFIRAVTSQAFKSAEQVIALNFNASLVSVERSSTAVKQLFAATDPRDLLLLTSHSQDQFQSLVSYSRELFGIAASARVNLMRPSAAPAARAATAPAPAAPVRAAPAAPVRAAPPPAAPAQAAPPAPVAVQASTEPKAAAAPALEQAIAEQIAKASKQLVVATLPEPAPQPAAKAKPLAKALSKVAPNGSAAEHPLASPVPSAIEHEIELPPIKPVEAAPPPAASRGAGSNAKKAAATPPTKGGRRK
jgi:phasin family protein